MQQFMPDPSPCRDDQLYAFLVHLDKAEYIGSIVINKDGGAVHDAKLEYGTFV